VSGDDFVAEWEAYLKLPAGSLASSGWVPYEKAPLAEPIPTPQQTDAHPGTQPVAKPTALTGHVKRRLAL
jgi:hypothetical protein